MAHRPGAMIQANRDGIQLIRVQANHFREFPVAVNRSLTQGNSGNVRVMGYGFRDDVYRIRIVEEASMGTGGFHIFNDAFHDMDRPQRHKEAARSLCLLANHAIFEWDAFIKIAGLKASRAKTRQDGIAVLQTFSPVRGSSDSQIETSGPRHFLGEYLNNTQALFIQIDKHNLRTIEIFALLDKRGHCASRTGAAPPDIR